MRKNNSMCVLSHDENIIEEFFSILVLPTICQYYIHYIYLKANKSKEWVVHI
jgi:hypothetical protein